MSNEAVETYLEQLYKKDHELERIKENIRQHGLPDISVHEGYGRLLTMLVSMSGGKDVLEIGALGGYSGCCLLRGMPSDGKLVSLELRQDYADIAKNNLTEAGYGSQVEYRVGEAMNALAELEKEQARFDFFFIDADKGNYPNYLEYAIRLARPGAIIAGDNLMLRGRTLDESKQGPAVQAMRLFNERIAQDERLISTLLPAYDGLALAIVR
ncbi:O-methyltransferase [Paenibacillus sp. chi10]|uniref:O-methyltransferase n=1 Tax=Paenibacillus suaedae TaxID=3077233 RepID=A0AAJ2JSR3_9BACL|nr:MULTISPECIES: O-methyltransferase [unclassified Paenibacillus]MDT8975542.1 O-methyltransferase [Paenibacillus sp. chi10]GAV13359.1 O-methyltransferase [Paenibacillus sp. NAIST15-1]